MPHPGFGILIGEINSLKMHGRAYTASIFLKLCSRAEIGAPDVSVVFAAGMEKCIKIRIHIIPEFTVIFLFYPAETETDKFKIQKVTTGYSANHGTAVSVSWILPAACAAVPDQKGWYCIPYSFCLSLLPA